MIAVPVHFYSYFKDLTGCSETVQEVALGSTLQQMHEALIARFPALKDMRNSTLIAVGVEYQPKTYQLRAGDSVSLFPPVQGG